MADSTVDVSDLKESLVAWANQNANLALEVLRDDLRSILPYSVNAEGDPLNRASSEPHLKDTEEVVLENYGTEEWRVQLAYTSPHASFTDTGSDAHPIDAPDADAGGRLVFYWPKVGKVVFAKHVEIPAQPGTRWWSDRVSWDMWAIYLQNAFDEGEGNR